MPRYIKTTDWSNKSYKEVKEIIAKISSPDKTPISNNIEKFFDKYKTR